MSNCAVCHKPVASGIVVHSECMELLQKAQQLDNKPLTIEELQEMGGEPVYVYWNRRSWEMHNQWAFVSLELQGCKLASGGFAFFDTYGDWWVAYRRNPNDWISVQDDLPKKSGPYFVSFYGVTAMAFWNLTEWELPSGVKSAPRSGPVTYWMPTPKSPEVET